MNGEVVFRPSAGAVIQSVLFVLVAGFILFLSGVGMMTATGPTLLVVRVASVFPALVTLAALLMLVTVVSRRIELNGLRLVHRQVFKNLTVPFSEIRRVELRRNEDGRVDTVKVFWTGEPLYVDAKAVAGFDQFIRELLQRAGAAERVEVSEFSAGTVAGQAG